MNKNSWKSAAGHVIGRSHEKEHTPCQDRALTVNDGRLSFIGVCDGAGSASHSQLGAEATLAVVSALLLERFEYYLSSEEQLIKEELLKAIIDELERLAEEHATDVTAFSSTLLFVVCDEDRYISGHIGDGLIVELSTELDIHSYPDNGAYANVTYFTTSADAFNRLRIRRGNLESINGFCLMSDGTSHALYRKQDQAVAPAISTIASWLKDNDEATVSEAIEQNLHKAIRQKTFDDCALAIMVKA